MKNKLGKYEKGIILVGIVIALIMLILITADGIKNIDNNNTPIALSEQEENITNKPNAPTMSAGMIPVKYEGDNLIICKNDSNWYNYEIGTPAYIMLNDGVYQSELVVDMTNKKLASENIEKPVTAEEQGSIYMWIPRFAINEETEEIIYVKQEQMLGRKYNQPEVFSYIVADETKPDYSLAGIWIEKEPLANASAVNTKIANMNKENNTYGFIANTVGTNDTTCPWLPYARKMLPVGVDAYIDPLPDPSNPNRTILKIINTNKGEPIKAKAEYNGETGQIEIQVTYNKNGIARIIDEEGNILSENSLTANTGNTEIENGKYLFTVIDNKENKKKVNITLSGIIPNYYGKVVTNYDCEVEGITWRVFHKDGNNIYLIADDYVPYDNLPTSTARIALNEGNSTYQRAAYFTNILNDYTGSEWIRENTNTNAQKWLTWLKIYSRTSNNIKAVAYMMDTESWSSFAGDKAEYAIGGPTLELFCASYKVTHPSKWIDCTVASSNGYQVKWSNNGSYTDSITGLTQDDYDSIYIKSDKSNAYGMWLASPSANDTNRVVSAEYDGGMSHTSYNYGVLGFRPVVCLNSGTKLHNNGDGTYSIEPAIEAKATYDETEEEVKIEVTYNKNKIVKILDEEGNILSENSLTATTGKKEFENRKIYTYTIIDEKGNEVKVKCIPVNSIIYAKDIIRGDYGKIVDNYTCANTGVSTWRIFHADDENIYLIADDYVPYENLPTSTKKTALNKAGDYKAYFTNILNDYTGSSWIRTSTNTNPNVLKWLTWINSYPESTNNNIKAVAYMMDTKSWSSFKGEKAEYAIGGPTLELFCASYKVTHPSKWIDCTGANEYGYQVKWSNGSYEKYITGLTQDDYDSIYIKSDYSNAYGMWLVAPAYSHVDNLMNVANNGDLGFYDSNYGGCRDDGSNLGFRPIVCLNSDVGLLDNGNGTLSIK